jgi:AAA family ATP:ADP antiporter
VANTEPATSPFLQILRVAVDVKPNELRALFLSFIYYFLILSSYYVIRPIRDEFGAASGVRNLPWLFTGTLILMLIANTAFAALVSRSTRRRFIPIAYRFFVANLLIFFVLLLFLPKQNIWIGRAFFWWTSVFNLFVLSVFWAFMVDVFNSEQGKRLFGFISVGGTLGAIVGAALTATLVQKVGTLTLLLISAALVELSAQCVRFFPSAPKLSEKEEQKARDEKPVGGGIWAGIVHNVRSPYLLGISAYILLYSFTSTMLYFQQVGIAERSFIDRLARTAFFAKVDLAVNILTIFVQIFVTGRLLKWLGVGLTLAILPALSVLGFVSVGIVPTLAVLVAFLTLRRATNFALARPARETLFTVVSREDKYKSKNFIDTIVYRTGDQVGAWAEWLNLSLRGASLVAAPLALAWLGISLWLGRQQSRRAQRDAVDPK